MVRCAHLLIGNRGRSFSRWSTVEDCEEPLSAAGFGCEQPDTLRRSASVLVFFGWLVGASQNSRGGMPFRWVFAAVPLASWVSILITFGASLLLVEGVFNVSMAEAATVAVNIIQWRDVALGSAKAVVFAICLGLLTNVALQHPLASRLTPIPIWLGAFCGVWASTRVLRMLVEAAFATLAG